MGRKQDSEQQIYVIETNIDDMNPQRYGGLMEKLFQKGALDVFWTPVQMKKNRPGVLVTVLSPEEKLEKLIEVMFKETTTFGVRYYKAHRKVLQRKRRKINGGRIKIGKYGDKVYTISPEYEDWKDVKSGPGEE